MSLALLTTAALAASGWYFQSAADPLGHAIYVAEMARYADLPQAQLKFSCGGIIGVELQFNLGQTRFDSADYSTDDPAWEDVRFVFAEGDYPATAKRAPLTEGVGTYEIKGGDAMFIAKLLKAGGEVTVEHSGQSLRFGLEGAAVPITQVIEQCPFWYPDQ